MIQEQVSFVHHTSPDVTDEKIVSCGQGGSRSGWQRKQGSQLQFITRLGLGSWGFLLSLGSTECSQCVSKIEMVGVQNDPLA